MAAFRHFARAGVVLGLLGCVDLPEPPDEPALIDSDAAAGAQLAIDGGGWIRPATGEPYLGPECDPPGAQGAFAGMAANAPLDDAGVALPRAGQGAQSAGAGGAAAGGGGPASRPSAPGDVVITELMSNPESVRDDAGEWFELYNALSDRSLDLAGCAIEDGSAAPRMIAGPLLVAPGDFAVVARSAQVEFAPDWVMSFSLANAADVLALLCDGALIDEVAYGAGFPLAPGASMALDSAAIDAAANDAAGAWCAAQLAFSADRGTPGAPNPACDDLDAGGE